MSKRSEEIVLPPLKQSGSAMERAEYYSERGEIAKAAEKYKEVVSSDPSNSKAWLNLGHCYMILNELRKSFYAYQAALGSTSEDLNPQLWYGLGLLYAKVENYEAAKHALMSVLKLDENFQEKQKLFQKLAFVYRKLQNFPKHKHFLKLAINQREDLDILAQASCSLAQVYLSSKLNKKAVRVLKNSLQITQSTRILACLGWSYLCSDKVQKAKQKLGDTLKVVESNSDEEAAVHYLLGRTLMKTKDIHNAFLSFQKALKIKETEYDYWLSMGLLYYESKQLQESFKCLAKASCISGTRNEVWYNLGILYETTNQVDQAIGSYTKASYIDSNLPKAKLRKAELLRGEKRNEIPPMVNSPIDLGFFPFFKETQSETTIYPTQFYEMPLYFDQTFMSYSHPPPSDSNSPLIAPLKRNSSSVPSPTKRHKK